jgi:hypothetical protein
MIVFCFKILNQLYKEIEESIFFGVGFDRCVNSLTIAINVILCQTDNLPGCTPKDYVEGATAKGI